MPLVKGEHLVTKLKFSTIPPGPALSASVVKFPQPLDRLRSPEEQKAVQAKKVKGKNPISRKKVNLKQTELPEEQRQAKRVTLLLAFPVAAKIFRY